MAIIDCVIWQPQGSPTVYAHKYPHNNLSTATQLIVQESQEAFLFSKGQLMGKFGPGKHTLHTENLPILRSLYGIPFGGKNPFTAEVWYVNRVQVFNIKWDMGNVTIHDVDYDTMLPITAEGVYGLKIADAERFLINVVGAKNDYTEHDLTEQFRGEFTTKAKSAIVGFMADNRIGFKRVAASLDRLSDYLLESMRPFWRNLGLELTRFYVSDISVDESTAEGRAVKKAMAQQTEQRITGHTWQQGQMFDLANNAVDGFTEGMGAGSGMGGMLGGIMALNMMNSMGGSVNGGASGAGLMNPQYNQPTFGTATAAGGAIPRPEKMVYCANCAHKYSSSNKFCPHCGHKYNPCPKCGCDNADTARRCLGCGTSLASAEGVCQSCGCKLTPGAAFCPECGHPTGASASASCSRCGSPLPPNVKFCPNCGMKRV